jgi:hypothetical protein
MACIHSCSGHRIHSPRFSFQILKDNLNFAVWKMCHRKFIWDILHDKKQLVKKIDEKASLQKKQKSAVSLVGKKTRDNPSCLTHNRERKLHMQEKKECAVKSCPNPHLNKDKIHCNNHRA